MLIDAHTHLDRYLYRRFGNDINPVLKQIEEHKILTISNSMDLASYETTLKIARKSRYVIPAFGVHPWNAHKYVDRMRDLEKLIEKAEIIGEVGLDYYYVRDKSRCQAQKRIFSLFLLKSLNRILSVHTKGAEKDVLSLLRKHGNKKVIIHWFQGEFDILDEMIKEGYCFSIVPQVKTSDHIREVVKRIPMKQLLTETDNPGGPASYSNEKGMPILIETVVEEIAKTRDMSIVQTEREIQNNLLRLADPLTASRIAHLQWQNTQDQRAECC